MQFDVRTPEAVDISYDLAGIGSRFLATAVDFTIIVIGFMLIVFATIGIGIVTSGFSGAAAIFLLTSTFLLVWGYYLIFEALWNGQTPGKRLLGIRAIKASGLPLGFLDSAIRNLVRIVDWLPAFYGIGLFVMFVSPRPRRLGDYAAGTVVVRERVPMSLQELSIEAASSALAAAPIPGEASWRLSALSLDDAASIRRSLVQFGAIKSTAIRDRRISELAARVSARIGAIAPDNPEQFVNRVLALYSGEAKSTEREREQEPVGAEITWNLRSLTRDDAQIVDEFLLRAPTLRPDPRRRLGSEIADRIAGKIGAEPQPDPEAFLHRVSVLNQLEAARKASL